ncbi:hypothetical protein CYY_009164 [Polysphondylium violaceum]|uniref:RING zinc finger-containing protein n=1 Tax=Polysphondylium violaceum TaxID=133409 RepID=A0A8J4PM18_9MYCE|nr:hypothetical protein CYY_009164 [Polysphondylium violaceum]
MLSPTTTTTTTTTTRINSNSNSNIPSFINVFNSSHSTPSTSSTANRPQQLKINIDIKYKLKSLNCLILLIESIINTLLEYKKNKWLGNQQYSEINNTIVFIKNSISLYEPFEARLSIDYQLLFNSLQNRYQSDSLEYGEQSYLFIIYTIYSYLFKIKDHLEDMKHSKLQQQQQQQHFNSMEILSNVLKTDSLLKQSIDQLLALFPSTLVSWTSAKSPFDHLLQDKGSRLMWDSTIGKNVALVPFDRFTREMESFFKIGLKDYFDSFQYVLDFTQDGYVSPYKLHIFLKWFGPITQCIKCFTDVINAKIISGFISGVEASKYLEGKAVGHYLIRFSKTYPGAFALTFVDHSNQVRHCLIHSVEGGLTLQKPPTVFKTLVEFVLSFSSKLKYAVGPIDLILFPPDHDRILSSTSIPLIIAPEDDSNNNNSSNIPFSSSPNSHSLFMVDPSSSTTTTSSTTTKSKSKKLSPPPTSKHSHENSSSSSSSKHKKTSSSSSPDHSLTLVNFNDEDLDSVQSPQLFNKPTTTSTTSTSNNNDTPSQQPPIFQPEKDICVVCMDRTINTVFLECGHLTCCSQCSVKLKSCPVCREKITRVVTIFRTT